jgi:APA family basic amino acid/polyamine antiporter
MSNGQEIELRKEISLYGLVMIAIGASIGVGIFLTPGKIADYVQTPELTLWAWGIGGVITMTGALTFAELGGMYPKAGGIYVYLKAAYGDLVAFLYGWVTLLVINTGSLAYLALAFAKYFNYLVPVTYEGLQYVAISVIILVTAINIFTVKIGELFTNIFTGLKIIGLSILIISGLYFAFYHQVALINDTSKIPEDLGGSFALALIGVLFSYGGWQHATYLAGEAKDGQRTVPRAMLIGAVAITVIYLLTNLAYLYLVPFQQLTHSTTLASDAMEVVSPAFGGIFIAIVIMVSAFGTAIIYTFGVPRIYFAMANDGVFFKALAKLHPRFHTPVYAIIAQSLWAILLIRYWGRLEKIINYVVFTDWCFFLLAAVSVIVLRFKKPNKERPYRTWGYPFIPLLFISIVAWFIFNILFSKDDAQDQALAGLFILSIGIPCYLYFKKYQNVKFFSFKK